MAMAKKSRTAQKGLSFQVATNRVFACGRIG
jgi:hypothetical protein